jgi:hypothetical protein
MVRKKFSRKQLLHFTVNMQVELIGMEACGGAPSLEVKRHAEPQLNRKNSQSLAPRGPPLDDKPRDKDESRTQVIDHKKNA